MNESAGKPNQKLIIALSAALALAAIAALTLFIKVNELKTENEQVKTQLAAANLKVAEWQPLVDKMRTMPIATKFTKLKGGDNAVVVSNLSRKPLKLTVTVNRGGKPQTFSPEIEPTKFWLLNGLMSGEIVDVDSEGFDSQQLTVP